MSALSEGPQASASSAGTITSTSNDYVKHCVRLRTSSKYRAEVGRFLLVGSELIREAAGALGGTLQAEVLLLPAGRDSAAQQGGQRGVLRLVQARRVVLVTEHVLRKVTGLDSADGIDAAVELALPSPASFSLAPQQSTELGGNQKVQPTVAAAAQGGEKPALRRAAGGAALAAGSAAGPTTTTASPQARQLRRLLALDAVQDPGNLGTLLRTAMAMGWDGAWLLPGCCDPFNDKAIRAGRGAALRLPLGWGDLSELRRVAETHGLVMLAADIEDEDGGSDGRQSVPGHHASPAGGVCLVLGSEGQGLSPEARRVCVPVSIPMAGDMESLNVGTAGGILMFMLGAGGGAAVARLQRRLEMLQQQAKE